MSRGRKRQDHLNGGYGGGYGKPRGNSMGAKPNSLAKMPPKGRCSGDGKQRDPDMPGLTQDREDGFVPSRKEVTLVNMNLTGKAVMGYTPRHKLMTLTEFLRSSQPEAVFIQDAFDEDEMGALLEKASDGKYEFHFQNITGNDDENDDIRRRRGVPDETPDNRSITGIAWNKDVYIGTPLQYDDERLKDFVGWLHNHDMSVVKLDSKARNGNEDVYPSFIAIAWHGPDYDLALRQRTKECEEFFTFLMILRERNWKIPIVIGGDFNMDMKSFNMKPFASFALVPYRPVSGSLAKDLKNTFMFTMDTMQVTETSFKQHHPDVYACPFITCKVRGRNVIKMWAVRRIQKNIRLYLARKRDKEQAKQKTEDTKKKWAKKIQADGYTSDGESQQSSKNSSAEAKKEAKDRKYALYWDEHLEPDYKEPELSPEEQARRRRKDFNEDKTNIMDDILNPPKVHVGGHRRKKYADLKSVQMQKAEQEGW